MASYSAGVIAPRSRRAARSQGLGHLVRRLSAAGPRAAGAREARSRIGGLGMCEYSPSSACFWSSMAFLNSRRVAEHPVLVDRLVGRGEDVEVAVAEDPAEEVLLQDGVVDLLEGAVRRTLVDDALDLQDPPVRDEVVLGRPGPVAIGEPPQRRR